MLKENIINSNEFPYDIEIIAINLFIPWAIEISKDNTLYVTERSGSIWIMKDGLFLPEPLITFESPFISQGEGGLMGIALDPDFISNHYIYVMHSYIDNERIYNRVVRLFEDNNKASIDRVILDRIPGGNIHNGGRIKIGPDQKLYITTGDAGIPNLSQDIKNLAGKILRINLDGGIPTDNPFKNSPVYSFGHRNPQGLAWNSNNILYESEHGQTAHDETNIIIPGANYGWPIVQGNEDANNMIFKKPLLQSNEKTWAPSGITFVNQGTWKEKLLVATLRGEQLISISLNNQGTKVEKLDSWLIDQYGRLREVIEAVDGSIYLTTSNRDGRGVSSFNDDKIIRLIPKGNKNNEQSSNQR